MSHLRDSRNSRLLNRAFHRLASLGKFPNFAAVLRLLRKLIGRDKSGSIVEPAIFKNAQPFPIEQFNHNLDTIRLELELLYDEAGYRGSQMLSSQVIMEERVTELRRQVLKIQEDAERELLLAGSNFLDAIVLRFIDRNHISDETTAQVDTGAGLVTLPIKATATRLLPVPTPTEPLELEVEGDDARILPGSSWAALFTDSFQSWQVRTRSGWLRVRTDFGRVVRAGRLDLLSPDEGMSVEARFSHDGVNFLRVSDPQEVRGGRVSLLFEARDVRFVELYCVKPAVQSADGHVITLDSLSLSGAGFTNSASLVTKDLTPTDGGTIKLARVDLDAVIPDKTEIKLLASGDGRPWAEFDGLIDFTASQLGHLPFTMRVAQLNLCSWSPVLGQRVASGQRYNGLGISGTPHSNLGSNDTIGIDEADVFAIEPLPANIDPRSIRLVRRNNWGYRAQTRELTLVNTCKLLLDPTERRALYRPVLDELLQLDAATATTLTVTRDVISGNNIQAAGLPDAQVLKATGSLDLLKMSAPPRGSSMLFIDGTGLERHIRLVGSWLPTWTVDFDSIFVEGLGEVSIVSYDLANNQVFLDPRTEIPQALVATAIQTHLQIRDLTKHVVSVTGNVVTFDVSLRDWEKVVISYNTPLDGINDRLVGPSVVVEGNGGTPVAGRDYLIRDGIFQVIPTGRLLPDPSQVAIPVTVKFKYVQTQADKVSYWTWATVPAGPTRIVRLFAALEIQHDEKIVWTDPTGKAVDLSGATSLALQPGVHRFSVLGRRAVTDYDTFDTTSALYKLSNLKASDGGYLFGPSYFNNLTGWPDALTPVTRFWLEHQAWNEDTEHFAWEDDQIIVAFDPRRPPDSLKVVPGATAPVSESDWLLKYRYFNSTGISAIRLKAVLSRDPGANPGVTPVIRGLTVRFTG